MDIYQALFMFAAVIGGSFLIYKLKQKYGGK